MLCVNLKCETDNWRWVRLVRLVHEAKKCGLLGCSKKGVGNGGLAAKSLNLMKLRRQIYRPKPLLLPALSAMSFSSSYFSYS